LHLLKDGKIFENNNYDLIEILVFLCYRKIFVGGLSWDTTHGRFNDVSILYIYTVDMAMLIVLRLGITLYEFYDLTNCGGHAFV